MFRRLLLAFTASFSLSSASAQIVITDDITPVKPDLELDLDIITSLKLLPPESWERECEKDSDTFYGDLFINHTSQIDPTRCIRFVKAGDGKTKGHLAFRGDHQDFHQLGRPYLETIQGSLSITGAIHFDELYFPRLYRIGGKLTIDFRNALEYVDMPKMRRLNDLKLIFRGNNVDADGLNGVTQAKNLVIENTITNDRPNINGLNGIEVLESFTATTEAIEYPEKEPYPDFLIALKTITEDVTVVGLSLTRLYGLDTVEAIGGSVDITDSGGEYGLKNLEGLGSLQTVAGNFYLHAASSVTSLTGLAPALFNDVELEHLELLADIGNLINASFVNGSVVSLIDVPELPCTQVDQLTQAHPNITVSHDGSCQ